RCSASFTIALRVLAATVLTIVFALLWDNGVTMPHARASSAPLHQACVIGAAFRRSMNGHQRGDGILRDGLPAWNVAGLGVVSGLLLRERVSPAGALRLGASGRGHPICSAARTTCRAGGVRA